MYTEGVSVCRLHLIRGITALIRWGRGDRLDMQQL